MAQILAAYPEAVATIVIAMIGWLVTGVWKVATIAARVKQCEKDINGVAEVVGTTRAMARLNGEVKDKNQKPKGVL